MALPRPEQKESKQYPKHPAGAYQLILADVIYLGHRIHEWKKVRKPQERVALIWQSLELHPDKPERFELANEFTYSVFDRASLRAFLEGWLGAFKSEAEAEAALVSLDTRIGENVIGTVVHKPSADGTKTYVNVKGVSPLMKGMQKQEIVAYTRQKFWAEKIEKYQADYALWTAEQDVEAAKGAERFQDVPAALQAGQAEDDDDSLPFD